jgi:hypothetical protein
LIWPKQARYSHCHVFVKRSSENLHLNFPFENQIKWRMLNGLLRNLCVSLGVRDQPNAGEPGRRVDIETPRRIYDRRCPRDSGLDACVNHPADPDCLTRALAEFAIGPVRATKPE